MIGINNKNWDELQFSDIEELLSEIDENFFFEFKSDDVNPQKLIKEISAFANTYGGYILLGVDDDKTISGCDSWNEQRIHTTIHDSITPTPIFDVKKFIYDLKTIYVIKIEEGMNPPYITNKGQIFERVSSGSCIINNSEKLSQLYYKRKDQLVRIKNKIELNEIKVENVPNLCGYIDIGFSLNLSTTTNLQKNFYKFDATPIANYLHSQMKDFSISRLGHSYFISVGKAISTDDYGKQHLVNAGMHDFIEIMCDGSAKFRILLTIEPKSMYSDIKPLIYVMEYYKQIYSLIFENEILEKFISAQKYEKLTVLKQFTPIYRFNLEKPYQEEHWLKNYLRNHKSKYGNNLIIESNRFPKNDYLLIDKLFLSNQGKDMTSENIIDELFSTVHINLGYIDMPI